MTHGIPSVYSGDEKGMEGIRKASTENLMWEDTELSKNIFNYYRNIAIRKEYIDVMLGDYVTRKWIYPGMFMSIQETDFRKLFIVINNGDFPVKIDVQIGKNVGEVKDLINDRIFPVRDSVVAVELEAISGTILDV